MLIINSSSRQTYNLSELNTEVVNSYAPWHRYARDGFIPDYAVKFKATEQLNLFIALDDIEYDFDIYLSNIYPEDPSITFPFANSTNHGNQDEVVFAQIPAGEYYLTIRNDSDFLHPSLHTGSLTFDSKTFEEELAVLPNDPLLNKQWYLFNTGAYSTELSAGGYSNESKEELFLAKKESNGILPNADIRAPEAWKINNSASDIVVAVIDQGIEVNHPDLKDNIWKNIKEIPGNNIDDDGNGYIDDVHGWNFGSNSKDASPVLPQRMHGTHVAGTIGAVGNNGMGITGVAWDVQLMPASVEDPESEAFVNTDKAVIYASKNGADIANCSFGSNRKLPPSKVMTYMRSNGSLTADAPDEYKFMASAIEAFKIARKNDMLLVIAAGNEGDRTQSVTQWQQIGDLDNTFSAWNFLSGFYNNAMNVASSDGMNQLSPYTNTGLVVDITAPGGNIESGPEYAVLSTMPHGYTNYKLKEVSDMAQNQGFNPDNVDSWTAELQVELDNRERISFELNGAEYGYAQGTSMAAPVVSGAAALVKAVNPEFTANDVRQILIKSADQNYLTQGIAGQNGLQLNLEAAIKLAEQWQGKKSFYDLNKGDKRDNVLSSSPSNTWLKGKAGNDFLRGNKGDDLIIGGAGDDLIIPGEGLDHIKGNSGKDIIRYYHQDESPIARPDLILMDAVDQIDLSSLDGNPTETGVQKLNFIGSSEFSGSAGELMAKSNGFFVDLDGDSFADFGALFTKGLDFEITEENFIL